MRLATPSPTSLSHTYTQAAGAVLTAAIAASSTCACGWLRLATLALLVLWLFCLPAGFVALAALRLHRASAAGRIRFRRPRDAGSWRAYAERIARARGDPTLLIQPAPVHAALRAALGAGGAACGFLALRAATGTSVDMVTAVVLAHLAAALSLAARLLPGKIGRRIVVALTNRLAATALRPQCRFVIDPATGAVTREMIPLQNKAPELMGEEAAVDNLKVLPAGGGGWN